MNIKKMVSAVAASAMLLTSAFSLAVNAGAYTTLQPLKGIYASAEISGYTDEMLKKVPLSEVLDSMTYRDDIYEYKSIDEASSAMTSESSAEGTVDSNSDEKTEAFGESSVAAENDTEPVEEDPAESESVSAEDEPVAQANTERVLVHSAGDKVEFAPDAKYVWVGDQEYSISDGNATVDLRAKYSSDAEEEQYTLTKDIIVGKAKQLSPTDIVYKVTITVNQSLFTFDDVSFYYMKDGKEMPINADYRDESRYNSSDYFYYKAEDIIPNTDIYVKATPSIAGKHNVMFTITNDRTGKLASFPCKMNRYSDGEAYVNLDITAKDGDKILYSKRVYIGLESNELSMHIKTGDGYGTSRTVNRFIDSDEACEINSYYNTSNVLILDFKNDGHSINIVDKIVVGKFSSLNAAKNAEDIKSTLMGSGYEADYDSGVEFTIFLNRFAAQFVAGDPKDEYVLHIKVMSTKVTSSGDSVETDFANAFFRLYGVNDENGRSLSSIILNGDYDSYFKSHYQTALIYSDSTIDMSKLKIDHTSTGGAEIYDANKSHKINFDEPQDFTSGTINYNVAANGGQEMYPVTIKCNSTSGAELFVNGPTGDKEREVFFDDAYGMYHDIIIANVGDAPLEDLKVVLSSERNVRLDDYWRLDGETDFNTLGAFTSAYSTENLAKIRLRPETNADGSVKSGEVSGTLTITAKDQTPVTIKLIGHAGNPEIVTQSPLPDAVKYVPYSVAVATDNIHSWNKVTFALSGGKLPKGVELNSRTGEIYGVPQEIGEFRIIVRAINSYSSFSDPSKTFDITVKENTDENVYNASDESYTINTPVGTAKNTVDFVLPEAETANDQEFISNGEYGNFIDFWLNGKKLTDGTDYTSEEGSTKITIKSQTLSNLPKGSTNTIAAEFRVNGDRNDDLKRTAQNFTIKTDKPDTDPKPDNSGSTGGNTSTPNTPGDTGTSNTPGDIGTSNSPNDTSTPDTSDNTNPSAPSEGDIIFRPVPVNSDMADIINGITIFCPVGVMSEDAVLIVEPDGSISADKGTALDIVFTLNGEKVQPSGSMTVRIPIPDNLKSVTPLYVYHITDGKFIFVDSWIDGEYVCFKANGFSTYIVSGKKLDSNGNEITVDDPGTTQNPITGIGISAAGLVLSGAVLTSVLAVKKKKH